MKYVEPAGDAKAGWRRSDGLPYFKPYPTAWEAFLEEEGIPIFRGVGMKDARDLPRQLWSRVGGKGSYIQLIGTNNDTGMFVVEIPPRDSLKPQRHLYEERYVVIEGHGTTEVWKEGSSARTSFEWRQWSIFSIPLNSRFRIANDSSSPAVLVAANSAPRVMNLFRNQDFIFNNPFNFDDRFGGNLEDFWQPNEALEPQPVRGRAMLTTNLIPDSSQIYLPLDNNRGPGHRWLAPNMTSNTMLQGWIAEYPSGRYAKAHAHAAGAVLVCLGGKGYSITWPKEEGGMTPWADARADLVKLQEYEPGGMISAAPGPANWYHQHFAYGRDPMRFFLITGPVPGTEGTGTDPSEEREGDRIQTSLTDVDQGGLAIPYYLEDPEILRMFKKRLDAEKAALTMPREVYTKEGANIRVMDV